MLNTLHGDWLDLDLGWIVREESSIRLLGLSRAGLSWSGCFEEVESGNLTAAGCLKMSSGQLFEAVQHEVLQFWLHNKIRYLFSPRLLSATGKETHRKKRLLKTCSSSLLSLTLPRYCVQHPPLGDLSWLRSGVTFLYRSTWCDDKRAAQRRQLRSDDVLSQTLVGVVATQCS